jgi:hypothetical protein
LELVLFSLPSVSLSFSLSLSLFLTGVAMAGRRHGLLDLLQAGRPQKCTCKLDREGTPLLLLTLLFSYFTQGILRDADVPALWQDFSAEVRSNFVSLLEKYGLLHRFKREREVRCLFFFPHYFL